MEDLGKAKVESALAECRAHAERIVSALRSVSDLFPLSAESLESLDENQVAYIDQFIYRFTKLQDAMGMRLLPAVHAFAQSDEAPRPFIEILARLEKLGFLDSMEDWQYFRNLRNNLSHEYPERKEKNVDSLNALHQSWPRFDALYRSFAEKTEQLL